MFRFGQMFRCCANVNIDFECRMSIMVVKWWWCDIERKQTCPQSVPKIASSLQHHRSQNIKPKVESIFGNILAPNQKYTLRQWWLFCAVCLNVCVFCTPYICFSDGNAFLLLKALNKHLWNLLCYWHELCTFIQWWWWSCVVGEFCFQFSLWEKTLLVNLFSFSGLIFWQFNSKHDFCFH